MEDPLSEALIQGNLPRPGDLEIYLGETGIYYRSKAKVVVEELVAVGAGGGVAELPEPPAGTLLYSF